MHYIGKFFLLTCLIVNTGCSHQLQQPTEVIVDASKRYQSIDGWAYMPRMWEEDKVYNRFDKSFEPYAEAVSRYLVNEVGINAVRIEIQSGMENPRNRWKELYNGTMPLREFENYRFEKINDNNDSAITNLNNFQFEQFDWRLETMVLPVKRALQARGEKLYINVNYTDFGATPRLRQGSLNHAENPDEYAEFVLVYFRHLREKYQIIPDSFEMILEPDNTTSWSGINIGKALVVVKKRLAKNGFHPEIIATSAASTSNAISYFNELTSVPHAVDSLSTLSYHRYGESTDDVNKIHQLATRYHLKTAMLEKLYAGIDVLLEDLTVGQVSSWQQWASAGKVYEKDKGAYYVRVNPQSPPRAPEISMSKQTRQLSSVFKFVRRDAVRIGSNSDNPQQKTVAFINPDKSWVIVIRNKTFSGPVTVKGMPAGRYGVRFVSDKIKPISESESILTSADGNLKIMIPEPGVLTIYSKPGTNQAML